MKIKHLNMFAAIALSGALLVSCGKSDSDAPSPDAVTEEAVKDLDPAETLQMAAKSVAEKQAGTLWAMLPESYQADMTSVVHEFANSVDPDVYQASADLLKKLIDVLQDKQEFILSSPMLEELVDGDSLREGYSAVVGLFDTIINSELGDIEKLKTVDLSDMMAGTGNKILEQLSEAAGIMGDEDPFVEADKAAAADYEVISEEGNSATVKVTMDGESEEIELTKVDGKWILADMAEEFTETMAETRAGIAEIDWTENKMTVLTMISGIDSTLDELKAANTEEEFNAAIMELMGGLMGGMEPGFDEPGFDFDPGDESAVPGIPAPGAPGLPAAPPPPAAPELPAFDN